MSLSSTRRSTVPAGVAYAVLKRCAMRCEVCSDPLGGPRGLQWALHHRRYRDNAPDMHSPQNLLAVCGPDNFANGCHRDIHQDKDAAKDNGWSISRHEFDGKLIDPLEREVLIDRGSRYVYLTAAGEYADEPPDVTA